MWSRYWKILQKCARIYSRITCRTYIRDHFSRIFQQCDRSRTELYFKLNRRHYKTRPCTGFAKLLGRLYSLGVWTTISFQVAIKHTQSCKTRPGSKEIQDTHKEGYSHSHLQVKVRHTMTTLNTQDTRLLKSHSRITLQDTPNPDVSECVCVWGGFVMTPTMQSEVPKGIVFLLSLKKCGVTVVQSNRIKM